MSEPKERIICTDTPNSPNLLAGYISVFVAAALFGSAFTMAKQPLANTDPLLLSSVVYVISGLANSCCKGIVVVVVGMTITIFIVY